MNGARKDVVFTDPEAPTSECGALATPADIVRDLRVVLGAAPHETTVGLARRLVDELLEWRGAGEALGFLTATPRASLIRLVRGKDEHHEEHHLREGKLVQENDSFRLLLPEILGALRAELVARGEPPWALYKLKAAEKAKALLLDERQRRWGRTRRHWLRKMMRDAGSKVHQDVIDGALLEELDAAEAWVNRAAAEDEAPGWVLAARVSLDDGQDVCPMTAHAYPAADGRPAKIGLVLGRVEHVLTEGEWRAIRRAGDIAFVKARRGEAT